MLTRVFVHTWRHAGGPLRPLRCRPARHPTHLPVQAQPAVPLIAAQQLWEGWHPLLKHHKLIRIYKAWRHRCGQGSCFRNVWGKGRLIPLCGGWVAEEQQRHEAMQQQLVWRTTRPVHQGRHTQWAELTHPAVPLAVPLQAQAVDGPLRSRGDGPASSGLMGVHVQT